MLGVVDAVLCWVPRLLGIAPRSSNDPRLFIIPDDRPAVKTRRHDHLHCVSCSRTAYPEGDEMQLEWTLCVSCAKNLGLQ